MQASSNHHFAAVLLIQADKKPTRQIMVVSKIRQWSPPNMHFDHCYKIGSSSIIRSFHFYFKKGKRKVSPYRQKSETKIQGGKEFTLTKGLLLYKNWLRLI